MNKVLLANILSEEDKRKKTLGNTLSKSPYDKMYSKMKQKVAKRKTGSVYFEKPTMATGKFSTGMPIRWGY